MNKKGLNVSSLELEEDLLQMSRKSFIPLTTNISMQSYVHPTRSSVVDRRNPSMCGLFMLQRWFSHLPGQYERTARVSENVKRALPASCSLS